MSQPHLPLQTAHEGHWYRRGWGGGGVHVSVIDVADPIIFAVIYGLEPDGTRWWAAAQGPVSVQQVSAGRACYALPVFINPVPGEPPLEIGMLTIFVEGPDDLDIGWSTGVPGHTYYQAVTRFSRLTRPVEHPIGFCNTDGGGFSPPRPTAPARFCRIGGPE